MDQQSEIESSSLNKLENSDQDDAKLKGKGKKARVGGKGAPKKSGPSTTKDVTNRSPKRKLEKSKKKSPRKKRKKIDLEEEDEAEDDEDEKEAEETDEPKDLVLASIADSLAEKIEENARKSNLTTANVKSILHHLFTDKLLVEFAQRVALDATENDLNATNDLGVDTRLTRSKWKKSKKPEESEHPKFFETELEEDSEEDEEYDPENESLVLPSDDDSIPTPYSGLRSPSLPKTPDSCSSQRRDFECLNDSELDLQLEDESIFKVPGEPLSASKKKASSDSNEELIAYRTRSKISMKDLSLEALTASLDPPDYDPALYDFTQHDDTDPDDVEWKNWLNGLFRQDDVDESIEENDEDFNFMAFEEEDDHEEFRTDKGVKISQKELQDLLDGILDEFGENIKDQSTILKYVVPKITISDSQRLHISAQLQQHTQLLTQIYVLSYNDPNLVKEENNTKVLLNELASFRMAVDNDEKLKDKSIYYFDGLEDAMRIVTTLDDTFALERQLIEKNAMPVMREVQWERRMNRDLLVDIPPRIALRILSEPFFATYPELLPTQGSVAKKLQDLMIDRKRMRFFPSEDNLLALGMEQFGRNYELISKHLLPVATPHQLKTRVKNICSKRVDDDNPVRSVRNKKILPPLKTELCLTLPRGKPIKAIKDSYQELSMRVRLPLWIDKFNDLLKRIGWADKGVKRETPLMPMPLHYGRFYRPICPNGPIPFYPSAPSIVVPKPGKTIEPVNATNAAKIIVETKTPCVLELTLPQGGEVNHRRKSTPRKICRVASVQTDGDDRSPRPSSPQSDEEGSDYHIIGVAPLQIDGNDCCMSPTIPQLGMKVSDHVPTARATSHTAGASEEGRSSPTSHLNSQPIDSPFTPLSLSHDPNVADGPKTSSPAPSKAEEASLDDNDTLTLGRLSSTSASSQVVSSPKENTKESPAVKNNEEAHDLPTFDSVSTEMEMRATSNSMSSSPTSLQPSETNVQELSDVTSCEIVKDIDQVDAKRSISTSEVPANTADFQITTTHVLLNTSVKGSTPGSNTMQEPQQEGASQQQESIVTEEQNEGEYEKADIEMKETEYASGTSKKTETDANNDIGEGRNEVCELIEGSTANDDKGRFESESKDVVGSAPHEPDENRDNGANCSLQSILETGSLDDEIEERQEDSLIEDTVVDRTSNENDTAVITEAQCDVDAEGEGSNSGASDRVKESGNDLTNQGQQTEVKESPKEKSNQRSSVNNRRKKGNRNARFNWQEKLQEKASKFADLYFERVKETLSDKPDLYCNFLRLIDEAGRAGMNRVEVYWKLTELFVDYPILVEMFVGFLEPSQAKEVGQFENWLQFDMARSFLLNCESFYMKTKCYHELLKKKIELHESEKDSKKLIESIRLLFRGNKELPAEMSALFPDLSPLQSRSEDFEVIRYIPENNGFDHVDEFEEVQLKPCDYVDAEEPQQKRKTILDNFAAWLQKPALNVMENRCDNKKTEAPNLGKFENLQGCSQDSTLNANSNLELTTDGVSNVSSNQVNNSPSLLPNNLIENNNPSNFMNIMRNTKQAAYDTTDGKTNSISGHECIESNASIVGLPSSNYLTETTGIARINPDQNIPDTGKSSPVFNPLSRRDSSGKHSNNQLSYNECPSRKRLTDSLMSVEDIHSTHPTSNLPANFQNDFILSEDAFTSPIRLQDPLSMPEKPNPELAGLQTPVSGKNDPENVSRNESPLGTKLTTFRINSRSSSKVSGFQRIEMTNDASMCCKNTIENVSCDSDIVNRTDFGRVEEDIIINKNMVCTDVGKSAQEDRNVKEPDVLSAGDVLYDEKGQVIYKWSREDDRLILMACQKDGASEQTFENVAKLINDRTKTEVQQRFMKLMELLSKAGAN